jgi:hypothetical protein
MISHYSLTSRRFKNVSDFTVITHKVEDAVIAAITRAVMSIFKKLDKLDNDAKNLVGLLWVFKTILNSTLIPIDTPELRLKDRYQEILNLLKKQNIDSTLLLALEVSAGALWSKHKNNKFDRLISVSENFSNKTESVGLFGKILYGNDPACINFTISNLSNYGFKFTNIETKRQIKGLIFQKIFIVSPPMRSSLDLMKTIFYSGVTPEVNLVLYEHENFYAPSRIELPISSNFQNKIQKFKASKIMAPLSTIEAEDSKLISWAEENFWTDIHGGSRTKTAQSVAAHYILFDGGEGAFMPVTGKVLHIDKSTASADTGRFSYDLSHVDILNLIEGDYVLLRKNSSGFLFNEEIDGIDDDEEDDGVLDKITDWKNALGALLLTKGYAEIADLMRSKGVTVAPGKIKQWEGVDVIAPNSEAEFKALIEVLEDAKKLSLNVGDIKAYTAEKWGDIHEYRISRQKAGYKARQTVLERLLAKIEGLDIDSSDGAKNLDSQLGQNLLIRRVASIDQSISYVHQSSLYKIDDLRGNKWLR